MDINKLPDKCPRCGHTIFKQKVAINGFANKLYFMVPIFSGIEHPVMVVESSVPDNDFHNDIVCNACGATIVVAEINKL